MSQTTLNRRMARRQTHSSRSAVSVISAAVLLVVIVWLVLELVLSVTGNAALLIAPADLVNRLVMLADATIPAVLVGAGVLLLMLGAALVLAALKPGTKSKHILLNPRFAVVVDSQVLAAAISHTARITAALAPEQVVSRVDHKRITVELRPDSGTVVDTNAVCAAVEADTSHYGFRRPLTVSVSNVRATAVGA